MTPEEKQKAKDDLRAKIDKHKIETLDYWLTLLEQTDEQRRHSGYSKGPEDMIQKLVKAYRKEQIRKANEEFGAGTIPFNMLGSVIIPLFPNAVLWDYKPPERFAKIIPAEKYTAFEIKE